MFLTSLSTFEHIYVYERRNNIDKRVDSRKAKKAEKVFSRLGLKMSDAINIFISQVDLRDDLPFMVTTKPERLLSNEEQGKIWNEALGEY